ITGVGKYLKSKNPKVQIVAVDPVGSIVYDYFYTGKMGEAQSYKTEGIGEDFIPSNYDFDYIDDMVQVNDKESMLMTRRLVREEGIFAGGSCGAALAGALRYASERNLGPDKTMVVLLPDSGSRYLSKIFDDNWMRENQFLQSDWSEMTSSTVLERKTRKGLIVANCNESVTEVIQKMKANDISQLPVVGEREQLLGLVKEVGLLNYMLTHGADEAANTAIENASVIDSNVPDLRPNTPIETVMSVFSTHDIALVTESVADSEDKHVVGILTKIDLLDFLTSR
ncbi:MAG: pyridoxal-phosphate dependent enzyme, partial [Chloroflexota bacterium]